jgi:hypothetical protein
LRARAVRPPVVVVVLLARLQPGLAHRAGVVRPPVVILFIAELTWAQLWVQVGGGDEKVEKTVTHPILVIIVSMKPSTLTHCRRVGLREWAEGMSLR